MLSIKHEENFTIDYFLHAIDASCWEAFINEYFIKREAVDFYESRHPLSLMSWYPASFFEGMNFNPRLEADVDF